MFRQNFEKASQLRDSTATSRFFKLFPAIGWETEGLEAYATFVVDLVRARAPASSKSNSFLTRLLVPNLQVLQRRHRFITLLL